MEIAVYRRIAAEIAARITSGELAPGDPIPSTRQIMARHGVAMATASKVIASLRDQGLVHARPGVGTVVSGGWPDTWASRPCRSTGTSRTRRSSSC